MRMVRGLFALSAILLVFAAGCTSDKSESGQEKETTSQQTNYDRGVSSEPAHQMTYFMTRKTINFWIDTWGQEPNKLSYNYIGTFDSDGHYVVAGYYILEGLPVSYCTALTPPFRMIDVEGDGLGPAQKVEAPAMDAVYYSGGDCQRYYGKDATTGAYLEYNVPMNAMVRTTSEPLDNVVAPAFGPSTVEDVKKQQ